LAFIPTPNGVSLCFHFDQSNQNWQFCLTLRKSSGAPTPTDLANVSSAGEAWWTSDLDALLDASATLDDVISTDITAQGAPQDIEDVGTPGTNGGTEIGINTAICVSQRTAKRGRSYRGRAYVSGLNTSHVLNSAQMDATNAAAFASAFTGLASDLDVLGFDVVVASKQHNGVVTNPAEVNEVIAYIVDQNFDSQRRRLFGRGT